MKKGMCLAVVLLLCVASLAMAQRPLLRGNLAARPQLTLSASKAEFALGEPVDFVLQVASPDPAKWSENKIVQTVELAPPS